MVKRKVSNKGMNKNLIIGIIVVVLLLVGVFLYFSGDDEIGLSPEASDINLVKVRGGKPFHGEALINDSRNGRCFWNEVSIWRGVVETEENNVSVCDVYFRLGIPLVNNPWTTASNPDDITISNLELRNDQGSLISDEFSIIPRGNQKLVRFELTDSDYCVSRWAINRHYIIPSNSKREWQVFGDVRMGGEHSANLRLDLASKFNGTIITEDNLEYITRIGNTPGNGKTKKFECV